MARMKKSFLSHFIGERTYEVLKRYSNLVLLIGTGILVVLFLLLFFFHWTFVSRLLNLTTGTSLLFIMYIAAVILLLDIQVDVEEFARRYWSESEDYLKTTKYKMTIVWGVFLIVIGLSAIFFSNRYRKQYAFDCSTILVDQGAGIYHLEWIDDCELD